MDYIELNHYYCSENAKWLNILLYQVSKGYEEFYDSKGYPPNRMVFNDIDFPEISNKRIYILGIEVMSTYLVESGTMICIDSNTLTIFD